MIDTGGMLNIILSGSGSGSGSNVTMYVILGVFVLLIVGMMIMQTRRRKTAQAEYSGMLDTLRPGMRVKTVGGVIGTIKEIREEAPGFKTVLLETGSEKNPSLVLYDMQAIYGRVDDEKIAALAAAQNTTASVMPSAIADEPQNIQNHTPADKGIEKTENVFEAKKRKGKSK